MPPFRSPYVAAVLLALSLVWAGCGNDDDTAEPAGVEETATATPAGANQTAPSDAAGPDSSPAPVPTAVPDRPQRIVSLSPMATEILFAIGAGDQVVAVDEFSNYPPEAPLTDLSGWDPNVEAVLSYEPDLVVMVNDANDLKAGLAAVDVPVMLSPAPAEFASGYAAIIDLGYAVGRLDEALELVRQLEGEIGAALAAAPEAPVRVYHELDDQYYSVSSGGFIGAVYAALGAINIADEADADGFGYPQLTEEYIVAADPELIVITDLVGYTAADVAARPGWGDVAAVRNGNIVMVNADTASRWGPRLPRFIGEVADALQAVAEPDS